MRTLVLSACLLLASLAPAGVHAATPEAWSELAAARRAGWDVARTVAVSLAGGDLRRFPGVAAWLKDYRALDPGGAAKPGAAPPAKLDVDRLLTRSPVFWRAYFEITPADPPLMLMHAGLLLASGEVSRASYLLVVARQRPGMAPALRDALDNLLLAAQAAQAAAGREILEAARQHDAGAHAQAAAALRSVTLRWPQNALAHYELGLLALAQQHVSAGRKPPTRPMLRLHAGVEPAAEAAQRFASARAHDPLLFAAYVGSDAKLNESLVALGRSVRIYWEAIAKDAVGEAPDDALKILAGGLQQAGIDELAIAARQVVIARERGFDESDRRFLTTSLARLIPEGAAGEATRRVVMPRAEYLTIVTQQ